MERFVHQPPEGDGRPHIRYSCGGSGQHLPGRSGAGGFPPPPELFKNLHGGGIPILGEQSSLRTVPEVQRPLIWENTRETGADPSADAQEAV